MDFVTATKTCFKKYFVFRGRAQRSEYWFFYLFTALGSIILSLIDTIAFGVDTNVDFAPLSDPFSLAVLIPTLAAGCRRLHDIGRSGWWQLLPFAGFLIMIPAIAPAMSGNFESPLFLGSIGLGFVILIGLSILLLVWLCTDSHKGNNRFGDSPKYGSVAETFS